MSSIKGVGYGSDHHWERDITDTFGGQKGTRYWCRDCKVPFVHLYDVIPDIFEAMKEWAGVPEYCKAGAFEKNVQKLLNDTKFETMCNRLREEGINADEVREAFFRLDAIEAGEVE